MTVNLEPKGEAETEQLLSFCQKLEADNDVAEYNLMNHVADLNRCPFEKSIEQADGIVPYWEPNRSPCHGMDPRAASRGTNTLLSTDMTTIGFEAGSHDLGVGRSQTGQSESFVVKKSTT